MNAESALRPLDGVKSVKVDFRSKTATIAMDEDKTLERATVEAALRVHEFSVTSFTQMDDIAEKSEDDWCEEHGVPESKCLACNPELAGADPNDWCAEHGVPESQCTICHPEILEGGEALDWCKEHGVPESTCPQCHPEIAATGGALPDDSDMKALLPPSDEFVENSSTCLTHKIRVQFAYPESVAKAGIKLEQVQERPVSKYVRTIGEIGYDQTHVARLSSRVPGTVWKVEKEIGDPVTKGEVVALVDAMEVGSAKAELLQAVASVDVKEKVLARIRTAESSGLRTKGELQEAEAALKAARIRTFNARQALVNLGLPVRLEEFAELSEEGQAERLRFLGIPKKSIDGLDPEMITANLIPVRSPFDGVVISKGIVPGEVVETSQVLFVVADIATMWVVLNVGLEDVERLEVGQAVEFFPDSYSNGTVAGEISWISTEVDDKTRTIKVRADIPNPKGILRSNTFGKARVVIRENPKAVVVPEDSVHWEGCCYVVFVRQQDTIYETRKINLGTKAGGFREIIAGLVPGEIIATTGSHVMKSELLKNNLGAG